MSARKPPVINPLAPANPTQVIVLQANDLMTKLREHARSPGRPKLNVADFADEMIERLECGESLLSICGDAHMPSYAWCKKLARTNAAFLDRVEQATQSGQDALVDLQYNIASGGVFSTGDTMRDRELINVIRWIAGKRSSRKYGEKILSEGGIMIVARPIEQKPDEDGLDGFLE